MTTIVDTVIKALINKDNDRPRTKQKTVGVSSLGGCRRKVWHMLQQHEGENKVLRLPSMMGTAIHTMIEDALSALESDDYQLERRVEVEGLPAGTIDLFIPSLGAVVDWKTTKKSSLSYFPSTQQRWQVQVYGYLLTQAGETVNTVSLVAIPRDGNERDIKLHTETYDETVALNALLWLELVQNGEKPIPEKNKSFCQDWCEFYGSHCNGKSQWDN